MSYCLVRCNLYHCYWTYITITRWNSTCIHDRMKTQLYIGMLPCHSTFTYFLSQSYLQFAPITEAITHTLLDSLPRNCFVFIQSSWWTSFTTLYTNYTRNQKLYNRYLHSYVTRKMHLVSAPPRHSCEPKAETCQLTSLCDWIRLLSWGKRDVKGLQLLPQLDKFV